MVATLSISALLNLAPSFFFVLRNCAYQEVIPNAARLVSTADARIAHLRLRTKKKVQLQQLDFRTPLLGSVSHFLSLFTA